VSDAIFYVIKSGCPWRMLPREFPAWKTVYHHFRLWARSGLLEVVNSRLRKMLRRFEGKKPRPSAAVIDSQSVRSDRHGGPVGYDAGKKIKGRKRFVCVDTMGWLLGVVVAAANVPERTGAKELLQTVLQKNPLKTIWADGGFSGPEFAA
jgi:putative transposase